ncbi:MAG: circadian clock KaiB family protein [Desulfovibrionales bacterium]|nr:circadian clock KaiB family protein [Desulfovibrionales bacterium]
MSEITADTQYLFFLAHSYEKSMQAYKAFLTICDQKYIHTIDVTDDVEAAILYGIFVVPTLIRLSDKFTLAGELDDIDKVAAKLGLAKEQTS